MVDFRRQALSLPGALEQPHHGAPSFRVAGKIFAQLSADESMALLKLSVFLQGWGVAHFPDACAPEPGRWGQSGWTRLRWRDLPEDSLSEMLKASWLAIAPASLGRQLDSDG